MAKLTISCKEATAFISKKEEGKLSPKQRLQLWMHIGICGFCKLFAKQNKMIINTSKNIDLKIIDALSASEKKLMIEKIESI